MVNIAIFASGNGSNFENLINAINDKQIDNAQCKVLIVDKENAYACKRAERLHIPFVYVNPKAVSYTHLHLSSKNSILILELREKSL